MHKASPTWWQSMPAHIRRRRSWRWLCVFTVLSTLLPICPFVRPNQMAAPTSLRQLGINSHIATRWQLPGAFPPAVARVGESGADWVREDIHWYRIQRTPDAHEWQYYDDAFAQLTQRGLNILAVLGHPPGWATPNPHDDPYANSFAAPDPDLFAAWAAETVARYRHHITYWQIWNEPDNASFWQPSPNPRAYAALVNATARAIAAVAPEAIIVAAGVNPFNPDFLMAAAQAGLWNSIDIVAIHPYVSPHAPHQSGLAQAKLMLSALFARYGPRPVWATEVGWSSGVSDRDPLGQLDDRTQAAYLAQGIPMLWQSGIDVVFWYALKDEQHNPYGLIRWGAGSDDVSQVRPAYAAFQATAQQRIPTTSPTTHTVVVSSFDDQRRYWVRGDEPYGTLSIRRTPSWQGSHALHIDYQFPPLGNRYLVFRQRRPLPLPAHTTAVSFMVYGDNSTTMLKLWLKDSHNTVVQLPIAPLGPAEWRSVVTTIPTTFPSWDVIWGNGTTITPPFTLEAIVLDDLPNGVGSSGTVVLDQFIAITP